MMLGNRRFAQFADEVAQATHDATGNEGAAAREAFETIVSGGEWNDRMRELSLREQGLLARLLDNAGVRLSYAEERALFG